MAQTQRIHGAVHTNLPHNSVFAGVDEKKRMDFIRHNIYTIRSIWHNAEELRRLKARVREVIDHQEHSDALRRQIDVLLTGFHDWADMDYRRGGDAREEEYTAIELYCSDEGFRLLFGLFNDVLRLPNVDGERLLVAVMLVEMLTIELYNLRLANIGDPRFANYQGKTYRGMEVAPRVAEFYRATAQHEDLTMRRFSVPLGFTSSSTAKATMHDFTRKHPEWDVMFWKIHVHGLDARLLQRYRAKYPTSVVTSLCAMPIGRVAEFAEKEVLLRGAFFHIVKMESAAFEGRTAHTLVLVTLNANRDHGSELGSEDGEKGEQRRFFFDMCAASRYEICANLARKYGLEQDVERYERLAKQALERIQAMDEIKSPYNPALADSWSGTIQTWLGPSRAQSFPRHYARWREDMHSAAKVQNWPGVMRVIEREYDSRKVDWFNVLGFQDGRTILHQMAHHGAPVGANDETRIAWDYLVEGIRKFEPWLTLRSCDDVSETAEEVARKHGREDFLSLFTARAHRSLPAELLRSHEDQLQKWMQQEAGVFLERHGFRMPQLSVLTELRTPELWVPIPRMYGGFMVRLQGLELEVKLIKAVQGEMGMASKRVFSS